MDANRPLMKLLPVLFSLALALPGPSYGAVRTLEGGNTEGTALLAADGAGTNGTAILCSTGATVQLIDSLGGAPDPGGTWSGPAAHPGSFNPATDTPGVFTYTVAGPPVSSATVTVTVVAAPNAGSNNDYTACGNDAPFSMRALIITFCLFSRAFIGSYARFQARAGPNADRLPVRRRS